MNHVGNRPAERAVLGSILRSPEEYWRVSQVLRVDHFLSDDHRAIYQAIADVMMAGQRLSLSILEAKLPERRADGSDMAMYLAVLVRDSEDDGAPGDFVETIVEEWARGKLAAAADWIKKELGDKSKAITETIAMAEQKISDIGRGSEAKADQPLAKVISDVIDKADRAAKTEFKPGIDTGIRLLDEMLGLIHPGDLGFVGAAQKEGKTALVTQIALRAAERGPVLMFQMDMGSDDVGTRILTAETGVPVATIEEGNFSYDEYDRMEAAKKRLASLPFYICDVPNLRFSQMKARAIARKRSSGLLLIVVDHLRKMQPDGKVKDIFERIEQATGFLKTLAKTLEVPVIALTQRTRGSQQRPDPTPQVSDFFGGGSIEQDADWVLGIFRRDQHLLANRPQDGDQKRMDDWTRKLDECRNRAELHLLAHRRRAFPAMRRVGWNGPATRFEND